MNFELDTEKAVSVIRSGFRIVLWVMVVLSMYFNEWSQVIAAAVLLAVLELEEINQKRMVSMHLLLISDQSLW
jgi:hypothetical protein